MKNAIIKCLSCCMMVVMILFLMTAPVVSACASGRKLDSVTGWTFSSPSTYTHAGTKSLTYYLWKCLWRKLSYTVYRGKEPLGHKYQLTKEYKQRYC